jgi:CheY-like chemotaxis protein
VHILVVEDDGAINDMLSQIFEEEGYTVVAVDNGQSAMAYLRANPVPCMILLDIMMPVMNGFQFLGEQQAEPRLSAIPVVVLTADVRAAERARSLAVARVLNKPIHFDDLLAVVQTYCGP